MTHDDNYATGMWDIFPALGLFLFICALVATLVYLRYGF